MHRNLSVVHPLYKLLHPHFRYQLAINCLARGRLLVEGGLLPENASLTYPSMVEVLKRSYGQWKFDAQSLPQMLATRGLQDQAGNITIPNYFYCEDGKKLWEAIHGFVTQVIENFYANDEDVAGDWEVQVTRIPIL